MTLKNEIAKSLKESEGYISGESLSHKYGISRTAVWKYIASLKKDGYIIDSAPKRGYLLKKLPDILDKEYIESYNGTQFIGKNAYVYEELDSTNSEAKRQGLLGANDGSVFTADKQDSGKGRMGHIWSSPSKSGLYFTILLRPQHIPKQITNVTLIAGLAVARALKKLYSINAKIKWPNDVVINGKKICGILTELSSEIDCIDNVVCGIGININSDTYPDNIAYKATSLSELTDKPINRNILLCSVLHEFEDLILNGLPIHEYSQLCVSLNKTVSFIYDEKNIIGTAVDVSEKGELVVITENNKKYLVNTGEVVVQGVYGEQLS